MATAPVLHCDACPPYRRTAALLRDAARSGAPFALTQRHVADAPCQSLVHTHKTLRRPDRRGLRRIADGRPAAPRPLV